MAMKNYPYKSILSFSVLLFVSPLVWGLAVKHDAVAAKGCTNIVSQNEAESALRRFNLTTSNATNAEVRAVGTGLVWIEELNGGRPLAWAMGQGSRPYPFKFQNNGANSWQAGDGIHIARRGEKHFGTNVAQLIHELGHLVGNAGGYALYRKQVGATPCVVSGYSDDKPNEQFAEVFAAFVTKPELIADSNTSACRKAFKFMRDTLFASGEKARDCKNNDGSLAE